MNIKCIIVEDEPLARNLLEDYISKVPFLQLIESCSNPLKAIEVLRNNTIDLIFLDIQMPEVTGLTFLKSLHTKPAVILTTAYSEYAIESYELDVQDYLLKPITFDRFLKAVNKISQKVAATPETKPALSEDLKPTEPSQNFIFVKDGTKLVKIWLKDILYIEGLKDYVTIHTRLKKIVTLQRIKVLEGQLPENMFIRIHNSFIVSLEGIDMIQKDKVKIGDVLIPISDTYKKQFKAFINKNNIHPMDF